LKDPGVDGKMIFRWIFRKWVVGHGLDSSGSNYEQMTDSCECGDELSGA